MKTNRLRYLRKKARLSQVALAAAANVTPTHLCRVEKWGFAVSLPTAERLAHALNATVEETGLQISERLTL